MKTLLKSHHSAWQKTQASEMGLASEGRQSLLWWTFSGFLEVNISFSEFEQ
jgi:hypothetical protein